ncbi:TRAP transporter substrate-binding protein [Aquamicrobium sp. LC103]|uniref:TRAP transporter substrate-binding protein n=1 Tax=Aquamicrobium sp. LC103 TaxID=1120658 RepID=UPI00063EB8C5|nr:TRAP transporter substrate-binding protein [Aquamicrobium sp. LC103]TKT76327.1 TRAP transporter substrate-binding protein [Aquamicrobium sp. LC103]
MKLKIFTAALMAASMFAGTASAEFNSRTIKVSNGASKDHPVSAGVDAMSACLEEGSGGKIKLRGFYSGALGDDLDATQSTRSGSIEMVVAGSDALGGIEPGMNVFGLPFLFGSDEEADAVLTGPYYDYLAEKMPAHGLVLLSFWENGFRNATNSRHPVEKMEDFKGLNFRVMQNNIFLETFRRLGANPVPMAFGEVFTALETGAVDGQENPLTLIEASKFYEVQKYLTLTRHAYSPTPVMFSKKVWDSYTPQEQELLQKCAGEGRTAQLARSREATGEALAVLKEHGMEVGELSEEEMARLREAVMPVYEANAATIGKEALEIVQGQLAEMRGQ